MCNRTELDHGSAVSPLSPWNLTGNLVHRVSIPVEKTLCNKQNSIVNAFLPVPKLTRKDANNLCKKFGENVRIAGNFEEKEDFDTYYDSLKDLALLFLLKYCDLDLDNPT